MNRQFCSMQIITLVILVGILLRFQILLINNSLWLDEASLSFNILSRNFWEVTKSPDPNIPNAPILFLWLVKSITITSNASEMSLRFVPFLSASAALIGFFFCSKEVLCKNGAIIAVIFFAFSTELISYAAEAKQYSTDVLVSVVVTYLGFRLLSGPSALETISCIFLPTILIWLSYPTPFLPSAVGIVGISQALANKDTRQTCYLLISIS